MAFSQEGQTAQEEEVTDFDLQSLPNNGLCLDYGRYHVRILKSDDGGLPVPGPSKKRQAFWRQEQMNLYDPPARARSEYDPVNLIVLWDVDSNYNLAQVKLSCPKDGDTRKESVEDYWTIGIPHPVEAMESQAQDETGAGDDDLDISPKKSVETGTEEVE